MQTRPTPAEPEELPAGGSARGRRRSLIGQAADVITLIAVFLAPMPGLGFGGRFGFAFSDFLLGVAGMARGLHLLVEGVPVHLFRRQSYLGGLLTVFAVAGLAAGFANDDPLASTYVFTLFSTLGVLALVITYGHGDPRRDGQRLLTALVAGCAVLGVSTLYGPSINAGRALGYSVHPNALGHSCVLGLAGAVWLWDNAPTRRQRYLWAGAALLCLLGINNSGSRGGILAVAIAAILYLLLRGRAVLTIGALGAAWLFALLLGTGVLNLPATNPIERLAGNETTYGANEERGQVFDENVEQITKDPIWGEGFDTIDFVHVVYFQGWIGGGAIDGLALMVLGLTMLFMPLWQRPRDLALACGAAGIAVAWCFTNLLTPRDQWVYIALTFGMSRSFMVAWPEARRRARPSVSVQPAEG